MGRGDNSIVVYVSEPMIKTHRRHVLVQCSKCGAVYELAHVVFGDTPEEERKFWKDPGCPDCKGTGRGEEGEATR